MLETGLFYFLTAGSQKEILSVRGTWVCALDGDDFEEASQIAERWNAENFWPKTYPFFIDEGFVRLNTEVNADYEYGVSDQQLRQHVRCAISTSLAFFALANETFPAAWETFQAEVGHP